MHEGPNGAGLSRKAILSEIYHSLKRLGVDYVDLYQIQRWDYQTPIEETMEVLHDIVRAGKARYRCDRRNGSTGRAAGGGNRGKARGPARTYCACLAVAEAAGDSADHPKITHLEDAVGALSVKLTQEEVASLEESYVPHPIVGHQ